MVSLTRAGGARWDGWRATIAKDGRLYFHASHTPAATLDLALNASGLDQAKVIHRPRLLSDNGSSYIAADLAKWLDGQNMEHVHIYEHAMMFFHGLGANGKSVLVSTLSGILGNYHRTASIETFTASHVSRHTDFGRQFCVVHVVQRRQIAHQ